MNESFNGWQVVIIVGFIAFTWSIMVTGKWPWQGIITHHHHRHYHYPDYHYSNDEENTDV